MNERIKKKIEKLMALSESANPHEAESALRKAMALMREYQIEHSDLGKEQIETVIRYSDKNNWRQAQLQLAAVIYQTCGVFIVYQNGDKGSKTPSMAKFWLTGTPSDIERANYFFDVASRQIFAQRCTWRRAGNHKVSEANAYERGLVLGYSKRFKALMQEQDDSEVGTGLIPIDTRLKDAEAFYRGANGPTRAARTDTRYLGSGLRDSEKLNVSHGVTGARHNHQLGCR